MVVPDLHIVRAIFFKDLGYGLILGVIVFMSANERDIYLGN